MKNFDAISTNFLNKVYYSTRRSHTNIIIHYTACENDRAYTIAKNFSQKTRQASSDYVVDNSSCEKLLSDNLSSWCTGGSLYNDVNITGGGSMYGILKDVDSINIEMCNCLHNLDLKTVENTIWLVKQLQHKFKISKKNLYRHFDVNGKYCPRPMCKSPYGDFTNNWILFKKLCSTKLRTRIKINSDGTAYKRILNKGIWIKVGKFDLTYVN